MKSAILFSSVGVMAATNQFVSKSIAGNVSFDLKCDDVFIVILDGITTKL